jgi:hypothetical protein
MKNKYIERATNFSPKTGKPHIFVSQLLIIQNQAAQQKLGGSTIDLSKHVAQSKFHKLLWLNSPDQHAVAIDSNSVPF